MRVALRIGASALAICMGASGAIAQQQADDLVIMRRVIAPAKPRPTPSPTGAVPTPTTSPTPATSPTPGATPDPTPTDVPAGSYQAATSLRSDPGRPLTEGALVIDFRDAVCVIDGKVSAQACPDEPYRGDVGLASVPALTSKLLRTIALDVAELRRRAPLVASFDAICASTVTLVGADGSNQTWRVTCSSDEVEEHYEKKSTTLVMPREIEASPLTPIQYINPICIDTRTGLPAEDSTRCNYYPDPEPLLVPAIFNESTGVVALDGEAIRAELPDINEQNYSNICSGTTTVTLADGTKREFVVSCDPDDAGNHYQRVPSQLADPRDTYGDPVNRHVNVDPAATEAVYVVTATACMDVRSKRQASQNYCRYAATGSNVYDLVRAPATFNADLKAIHIGRMEFEKLLPLSSETTRDSLCRSTMKIGSEAANAPWIVRCDPAAVTNLYERHVAGFADPYSTYATQANRMVNNSFAASSFKLAVSRTGCWDNTLGKASTDTTRCSGLLVGPNVYDLVTVPATIVPQSRLVVLSRDAIQSMTRYVGAGGTSTGSYADLCSGSKTMSMWQDGKSSTWTISCNPSDASTTFARYARTWSDPQTGPASTRNLNSDPQADRLSLLVASTSCENLATGTTAIDARCEFQPTGANVYDVVSVPAVFRRDLRMIQLNRADFLAMTGGYERVTGNGAMGYWCEGAVRVVVNGVSETWTTTCDAALAGADYVRLPTAWSDPYYYSAAPANKNSNSSATATSLNLAVSSTTCWNKTTGKAVSSAICQYQPNGANLQDLLAIPATFRADMRRILIDGKSISDSAQGISISTTGNAADWCSKNVIVQVGAEAQTWKTTCVASDIQGTYQRFAYGWTDVNESNRTADRTLNSDVRANNLKVTVVRVGCLETAKNQVVSDSDGACTYLPGPSIYDVATVPATFRADTRRILLKESDIAALGIGRNGTQQHPNYQPSAWCAKDVIIRDNGSTQTWTTTCDAETFSASYQRYATTWRDPQSMSSYTTEQKRVNSDWTTSGTLSLAVIGTRCRRTDTSADVSVRECNYLTGGANDTYGDVLRLPALYNAEYRRIVLDRDAITAKAPFATGAEIDVLCNMPIAITQDGTTYSWNTTCNAAYATVRHKTEIARLRDPYNYYGTYYTAPFTAVSGNRRVNTSTSGTYSFSAITNCIDTTTGETVSGDECTYLSGMTKSTMQIPVPAVYDPVGDTVTVRNSDIDAAFPSLPTSGIYSRYALCGTVVYVTEGASSLTSYRMICQ